MANKPQKKNKANNPLAKSKKNMADNPKPEKKKNLAKSKFAHVKDYEIKDPLKSGHFIVVRVHCSNFARFSEANEFTKPNDEKALNLMNSCALSMCKEMSDIILAYGFGHEYSFIFRKNTSLYTRRASKLLSVMVSLFTSSYRMKWREFFPKKDMTSVALFEGEVLCLKDTSDIQTYLAFKQEECDEINLTDTCFWKLVESGKSEQEAQEILELCIHNNDQSGIHNNDLPEQEAQEILEESEEGEEKLTKNEILFQQFGIQYNKLPVMFRKGSCILKTEVENRGKLVIVHTENIASTAFLNSYPILSKELTDVEENASSILERIVCCSFALPMWLNKTHASPITKEEQLKLWRDEKQLKKDHWIVVRIDGCRFSRFTKVHEFTKPFDEPAATLMNACALAVFEEFKDDILYAYGQSDEYSFLLEKNTQLFERSDSKLVSAICSVFTDAYVKNWKEFFPDKKLQYAPRFDGRAVCYKSYKLIRDYISWRQVDCHMNTRSNTLFWARVNNGESKRKAQKNLQGADVMKERFQMLSQEFGIEYNQLPLMFRNGSSIFWDYDKEIDGTMKLVVEYPNVIRDGFWDEHAHILTKDTPTLKILCFIMLIFACILYCVLF